jgi:hypothetical protein
MTRSAIGGHEAKGREDQRNRFKPFLGCVAVEFKPEFSGHEGHDPLLGQISLLSPPRNEAEEAPDRSKQTYINNHF